MSENLKLKFINFPLGHGYGEALGMVVSDSLCSPEEHLFFFYGTHFLIYDHGSGERWELIQISKGNWRNGKWRNSGSRSIAFSSRIADVRKMAKLILKKEAKKKKEMK